MNVRPSDMDASQIKHERGTAQPQLVYLFVFGQQPTEVILCTASLHLKNTEGIAITIFENLQKTMNNCIISN